MFKPNPKFILGGSPKLYKGTARVRFEQSKKEILSEKPLAFLHYKSVYIY